MSAAIISNSRFVHYTTADTATKIIRNQEVWLRKANSMNDFLEIEYGFDCLYRSYAKHKGEFEATFEDISPGVCGKIEAMIDAWLPSFRNGTYLACMSEHQDVEDVNGRLSMWRAYGGSTGVAIVMNGSVFLKPISSDALKAYTSPVAYFTEEEFDQEFNRVINSIKSNREFLKNLNDSDFFASVFHAFRYSIMCTKHPGFAEEREWRVIYCPTFEKSEVIAENIETIAGVPQKVCKLKLTDNKELGIVGFGLPQLVDRVIVGPCQHPTEVAEALSELMNEAGIMDAKNKVVISNIPLRQPR